MMMHTHDRAETLGTWRSWCVQRTQRVMFRRKQTAAEAWQLLEQKSLGYKVLVLFELLLLT
jgi:hypothetical protein